MTSTPINRIWLQKQPKSAETDWEKVAFISKMSRQTDCREKYSPHVLINQTFQNIWEKIFFGSELKLESSWILPNIHNIRDSINITGPINQKMVYKNIYPF